MMGNGYIAGTAVRALDLIEFGSEGFNRTSLGTIYRQTAQNPLTLWMIWRGQLAQVEKLIKRCY